MALVHRGFDRQAWQGADGADANVVQSATHIHGHLRANNIFAA
jgi:hypothetical protein